MGLRGLLRSFAGSRDRYAEDDFPSVVLLLRRPEFPGPEDMVRIARESWGAAGPVESIENPRKGSYLFSCQTGPGTLFIAIHTQPQSYATGGQEPTEFLQRPWDDHAAWMSIDMPNGRNRKLAEKQGLSTVYKMLLIFAFKIWGANTLAVFFPAERITIPNFGDLAACIQWARRTGMDMSFLD